jgi:hypothetical protein
MLGSAEIPAALIPDQVLAWILTGLMQDQKQAQIPTGLEPDQDQVGMPSKRCWSSQLRGRSLASLSSLEGVRSSG